MKQLPVILLIMISLTGLAQTGVIRGNVYSGEMERPLQGAQVFLQETGYSTMTDAQGRYRLSNIPQGDYTLVSFYLGLQTASVQITVGSDPVAYDFYMEPLQSELESVTVRDQRETTEGITRLNAVQDFGIYEAKKNEVVVLDDMVANKAANNARQVFAKVAGLNIWESDCAGLQIGVGSRGLSPNRNSNFNTRQNGYDISADALGYPESYYSPALQAVDRIEIVRGAASLQYGTQFGGLVNFIMKKGPSDKKFEFNTEQTINSLGFYNSFISAGGTIGKVNYYAYNRTATGDCYRCNSDFTSTTSYARLEVRINDKLSIGGDYTHMYYLAQQPGGLTDALFNEDPYQSIRERNWFRVNWNLMSVHVNYAFSPRLKLNSRTFGLIGGRDALGNLGRIDRTDNGEPRDLFVDDFRNFGNETRLLYYYQLSGFPQVLLAGGRIYKGLTLRQQGLGPDGNDADFTFLNPDFLEGSDYEFPGTNYSLFAENMFTLSERFTITPGFRFEYIDTRAEGYYLESILVRDPDSGLAVDSVYQVFEDRENPRSFIFGGIGLSYKYHPSVEIYANASQNYRSINFNDIRVVNPNLEVDENIRDENGYNIDLGIRGTSAGLFNYDVSVFFLKYNDRIGSFLQVNPETLRIYRFRTNVADSRNIGMEAFGELNILGLVDVPEHSSLNVFANISVISARYISSGEPAIDGREVEQVPPFSLKTGINFRRNKWRIAWQYSYTAQQYSDATNVEFTPSAIEGIIPAYHVMDLSAAFALTDHWMLEGGINNLTDNRYFTRRATGYPGPGIIPADPRGFYFTVKARF